MSATRVRAGGATTNIHDGALALDCDCRALLAWLPLKPGSIQQPSASPAPRPQALAGADHRTPRATRAGAPPRNSSDSGPRVRWKRIVSSNACRGPHPALHIMRKVSGRARQARQRKSTTATQQLHRLEPTEAPSEGAARDQRTEQPACCARRCAARATATLQSAVRRACVGRAAARRIPAGHTRI